MGILEFALIYDEVNQLLMVNILRAKVAISRDDEIFELFEIYRYIYIYTFLQEFAETFNLKFSQF